MQAMSLSAIGHALCVPWEEGGFSGRRQSHGGLLLANQAADVERLAWRAFWRAGGHWAMAAEWRVESRRQDARMVACIVRMQGGGRLRFAAADVARWLSQVAPSARQAGAPPPLCGQ